MSFDICDLQDSTRCLHVNAWNWRSAIELMASLDLLDIERREMMGWNCTGVEISRDEAREIGKYITEKILPGVPPSGCITYDLDVKNKPDDGKFFRDEPEKNYNLSYEWLIEFSKFCTTCDGFVVI